MFTTRCGLVNVKRCSKMFNVSDKFGGVYISLKSYFLNFDREN